MERSHRLLLVAGLLAALLPAAAATFGTQPGAACKPIHLATQVALVCAPDMPTAECCAPVVAAVDLGGGVPCLCRVAAEPLLLIAGLNATHLLTLYNSCRPGGSHVAAACQGPAPPAALVSSPPPPPPSPAPCRKHLTCGAHLSPPPFQEHDDTAAHAKVIPAHASCGGLRPRGAHLTAACEGPAPPAAAVSRAPPSRTPAHMQPALSHVEDRTFSSCPRAHFLSASVGVECGFRTDDSSCCALLRYTVPPSNMVACLCTLGESDGVTKTGFDITDIVKIYAGCVGVQPDSIHIPKNGCREVLKFAPTPPPANANASSLLPTSSPMLEIH